MNFSNLHKAHDYEVNTWLADRLSLTPYQMDILRTKELVRCGPYRFYKQRQKEPVSILWRLTLIFVPIYWIIMFIGLPINFTITGRWGYSQTFVDKFHGPWFNKLKL